MYPALGNLQSINHYSRLRRRPVPKCSVHCIIIIPIWISPLPCLLPLFLYSSLSFFIFPDTVHMYDCNLLQTAQTISWCTLQSFSCNPPVELVCCLHSIYLSTWKSPLCSSMPCMVVTRIKSHTKHKIELICSRVKQLLSCSHLWHGFMFI